MPTAYVSKGCIGEVFAQIQPGGAQGLVGYYSRMMNPTECQYSLTDEKALAVVLSCQKFGQYILGNRTMIYTDHLPLVNEHLS